MKQVNEILANSVDNLYKSAINSADWERSIDVTVQDGENYFSLACEYVRVVHQLGEIRDFIKFCSQNEIIHEYK